MCGKSTRPLDAIAIEVEKNYAKVGPSVVPSMMPRRSAREKNQKAMPAVNTGGYAASVESPQGQQQPLFHSTALHSSILEPFVSRTRSRA